MIKALVLVVIWFSIVLPVQEVTTVKVGCHPKVEINNGLISHFEIGRKHCVIPDENSDYPIEWEGIAIPEVKWMIQNDLASLARGYVTWCCAGPSFSRHKAKEMAIGTYVHGGRLPMIFDQECSHEIRTSLTTRSIKGNLNADRLTRNVSGNLGFANFSCVHSHLLSCNKGSPNKENTSSSDYRHYYSGYKHPEGPQSHFSLSLKVLLSALVLVGGIYNFGYAFRHINNITVQAGAVYLISGMCGIAAGVIGILGFGFSQF